MILQSTWVQGVWEPRPRRPRMRELCSNLEFGRSFSDQICCFIYVLSVIDGLLEFFSGSSASTASTASTRSSGSTRNAFIKCGPDPLPRASGARMVVLRRTKSEALRLLGARRRAQREEREWVEIAAAREALGRVTLHCTALHCTALHCTAGKPG